MRSALIQREFRRDLRTVQEGPVCSARLEREATSTRDTSVVQWSAKDYGIWDRREECSPHVCHGRRACCSWYSPPCRHSDKRRQSNLESLDLLVVYSPVQVEAIPVAISGGSDYSFVHSQWSSRQKKAWEEIHMYCCKRVFVILQFRKREEWKIRCIIPWTLY